MSKSLQGFCKFLEEEVLFVGEQFVHGHLHDSTVQYRRVLSQVPRSHLRPQLRTICSTWSITGLSLTDKTDTTRWSWGEPALACSWYVRNGCYTMLADVYNLNNQHQSIHNIWLSDRVWNRSRWGCWKMGETTHLLKLALPAFRQAQALVLQSKVRCRLHQSRLTTLRHAWNKIHDCSSKLRQYFRVCCRAWHCSYLEET